MDYDSFLLPFPMRECVVSESGIRALRNKKKAANHHGLLYLQKIKKSRGAQEVLHGLCFNLNKR